MDWITFVFFVLFCGMYLSIYATNPGLAIENRYAKSRNLAIAALGALLTSSAITLHVMLKFSFPSGAVTMIIPGVALFLLIDNTYDALKYEKHLPKPGLSPQAGESTTRQNGNGAA